MLLYILLIAVAILCFILTQTFNLGGKDVFINFINFIGIVLISGVIFLAVPLISNNSKSHKNYEKYRLELLHESIVTQINYYKNTGILPENLMWDIAEYNEDVNYGKSIQKNIWVGAFTPNIYDEFELIEFKIK